MQPQDQRRCRVGLEHRLEPRLGVIAFGHVLDDEREAVGIAAILVHHDVVNRMRPARLVGAHRRDLDHKVGEALAGQHPDDRILAFRQAVMVAEAQAEPLAIIVRGRAQFVGLPDAVHPQRRRIGADDRTRRIDQDDPRRQIRHQLLEVA